MPKVVSDTTDTVKRAPRKRAVRRVISEDESKPVRRRTRTTTPKSVEVEDAPLRKAPVSINQPTPKSSTKKLAIVSGIFVLIIAIASWIGFSDAGQINVTERINSSNQELADTVNSESGNNSESVTVPVQNTPPAAISGLRPRTDGGGQPDPVPTPQTEEVSAEGATTTESTPEDAPADTAVSDESPGETPSVPTEGEPLPELAQ